MQSKRIDIYHTFAKYMIENDLVYPCFCTQEELDACRDEQKFNKMKDFALELGYAASIKDYKNNPDSYKWNIVDVSMVIRVCLTTKFMTPDLYDIMKLLGVDRIRNRISIL